MSHLDDDTLAAAAMGETLDPAATGHLASCAECQAEVRAIEEIAARASTLPDLGTLTAPPPAVWDAIAAELAGDERADSVVPLRPRRRTAWLAAAAAAVVVGTVGIGLAVSGGQSPTVVATAAMVDLATEADAGTARVEERADGTRVLVVDTTVTEVDDADLEVWLIDPNIEGMVSLGYLTADEGEFVIPAGYDVAEFPIVDVSVEPRDGVPTHSGDSVKRGVLGTTT
jgi:anti-sigma-K factor RskA